MGQESRKRLAKAESDTTEMEKRVQKRGTKRKLGIVKTKSKKESRKTATVLLERHQVANQPGETRLFLFMQQVDPLPHSRDGQ